MFSLHVRCLWNIPDVVAMRDFSEIERSRGCDAAVIRAQGLERVKLQEGFSCPYIQTRVEYVEHRENEKDGISQLCVNARLWVRRVYVLV